MSSAYRGGIIGIGHFAHNHLNGWNEVEGASIVAVCDLDENKAQAAAQQYNIPQRYTGAAQMMREAELDFVDIVTTVRSHRKLVELAAEHGLHVICQKPLAPSLADARAMVKSCREAGVKFMAHENFRWQTPMLETKAAAGERAFFFGQIDFRSAYDVYKNQPYLATDERFIIYDLGIHLLDLARFFMGEAESLMALTQRINPRIKGEDVATILLKMRNGATCLVTASYASKWESENFPETLVHLESWHYTVHLGRNYQLKIIDGEHTQEKRVNPFLYSWSSPPAHAIQESVARIQQHWVECLQKDLEPQPSGEDNLKTLELVFGAYQSAESGLPYRVGTL